MWHKELTFCQVVIQGGRKYSQGGLLICHSSNETTRFSLGLSVSDLKNLFARVSKFRI